MGSEWREARLEDVCEGVFDCPHSTPDLTSTGPFVVRSQDIRSGVLRLDNAARVSESTYRVRIARAEPRHGDLLYSREGTYFGIAAEVPPNTPLCLGQRMVLIRPNPALVDARFLLYWLNSPVMASHTRARRDGSVAERLNLPTIRALPVPVPPLSEQHRIAGILGALDDKIELNRLMSQTLESMARALFKSWFVDFDPVRAKADGRDTGLPFPVAELFPSSLLESELGDVPLGWDIQSLGDSVDLVKGRSYTSEELIESDTALVTLKSFARGGGYRPDGLKSFSGTYKAAQVVMPGELVVACTDVTQAAEVIGRPAIVRGTGDCTTLVASLDTMIVRPRGASLTRGFLYFLGGTAAFVAHTYAHTTGTTVLHLATSAVPSFRFACPPATVVKCFNAVAAPVLDRVQSLEEESDSLATLRGALLPRLLHAGESDTRWAEAIQ